MEIGYASDQTSETGSVRSNRVSFSGPLVSTTKSSKRSDRFKGEDGESYVEITLDVRDDAVLVHNIKGGDQEAALLASKLEKRRNLGSQLSLHLRHVSNELRRITSSKRFENLDRNKSGAARALRGLRFIHKNPLGNEGWSDVETRFAQLSVSGMLPKSLFGKCIG